MADIVPQEELEKVMAAIKTMPANRYCFDCGKTPTLWANVTYGTFLCDDCSTKHRSLGISSILRFNSDTRWTQAQLMAMRLSSNELANVWFSKNTRKTNNIQDKYCSPAALGCEEVLERIVRCVLKIDRSTDNQTKAVPQSDPHTATNTLRMADIVPREELEKAMAKIKAKPANRYCFDCYKKPALWANVTYGTFLCEDCSTKHRSFGISSILRFNSDTRWTQAQLMAMRLGSNEIAGIWFRKNTRKTNTIQEKYRSPAALGYKEFLERIVRRLLKDDRSTDNQTEAVPQSDPHTATTTLRMADIVPREELEKNMAATKTILANRYCFDCGKKPTLWANLTYGVLLCEDCSTEHRSLGISSILRFNSDTYWTRAQLIAMGLIDNSTADIAYRKYFCDPDNLHEKYCGRGLLEYKAFFEGMVDFMLHCSTNNQTEAVPQSPEPTARNTDSNDGTAGSGVASTIVNVTAPKTLSADALRSRLNAFIQSRLAHIQSKAKEQPKVRDDEDDQSVSRGKAGKITDDDSDPFEDMDTVREDPKVPLIPPDESSRGTADTKPKKEVKKPAKPSNVIETYSSWRDNTDPEKASTSIEDNKTKNDSMNPQSDVSRFDRAKAISSAQYFDKNDDDVPERNRLNKFQGSAAISSDQYFDRPQQIPTGYSAGMNNANIADVKDCVQDGGKNAAERFSSYVDTIIRRLKNDEF